MTDALERVRMMVEGVPDGCQILCDEPDGTAEWSLQVADLRALCDEVERLRRHDCERWASEGVGCAECNPTAGAVRHLWDDPVRAERDALKAEVERLRAELSAMADATARQVAALEQERQDLTAEVERLRGRDAEWRAAVERVRGYHPMEPHTEGSFEDGYQSALDALLAAMTGGPDGNL